MVLLALITAPAKVARILDHLRIPSTPPPLSPARLPAHQTDLLAGSCSPSDEGRAVSSQPRRNPKIPRNAPTAAHTTHLDHEYLEKTTVMAHASGHVTTTTPETSVREAAKVFVSARIGCLPVVDEEGLLIGILTQTDLLKWLARLTS